MIKGQARSDDKSVFSVSEKPLKHLEMPICFMPNGSVVAGFSCWKMANGELLREIIFWEKNGLRHGEFSMPDKEGLLIVNIRFSLDS